MKAIAMKATQEDWESVKDLVIKVKDFSLISDYTYLVTNYCGKLGVVSNMHSDYVYKFDRIVYEKFDKAIFLDALVDIVEEKIWKGTDMQFLHKDGWINCESPFQFRFKPINQEGKQLQELADKLGYKIEKL